MEGYAGLPEYRGIQKYTGDTGCNGVCRVYKSIQGTQGYTGRTGVFKACKSIQGVRRHTGYGRIYRVTRVYRPCNSIQDVLENTGCIRVYRSVCRYTKLYRAYGRIQGGQRCTMLLSLPILRQFMEAYMRHWHDIARTNLTDRNESLIDHIGMQISFQIVLQTIPWTPQSPQRKATFQARTTLLAFL